MTKQITETKQVIKKCVSRDLVGWENTQEKSWTNPYMILTFKKIHIFKQKRTTKQKTEAKKAKLEGITLIFFLFLFNYHASLYAPMCPGWMNWIIW